jgi:DNA-binding NarL/FixJ family response regulator
MTAQLKDMDALNSYEKAIMKLVAEGLSNRGIAKRLNIKAKTVDWYLYQIYAKLDVPSGFLVNRRMMAVRIAEQAGYINS